MSSVEWVDLQVWTQHGQGGQREITEQRKEQPVYSDIELRLPTFPDIIPFLFSHHPPTTDLCVVHHFLHSEKNVACEQNPSSGNVSYATA